MIEGFRALTRREAWIVVGFPLGIGLLTVRAAVSLDEATFHAFEVVRFDRLH